MSVLARLNTPIFAVEGIPDVTEEHYTVICNGLVARPLQMSLAELKTWPQRQVDARLTSVSGWSVRAAWQGVLWRDLLSHIMLSRDAAFATFTSVGGYTTSLPLAVLDHPRVLLAYAVAGESLEPEYGGPLRLVVPHRWGYKSCKWLARITFTSRDGGGFWEERGYSRDGMITAGETYDVNSKTRRPIAAGEVTAF